MATRPSLIIVTELLIIISGHFSQVHAAASGDAPIMLELLLLAGASASKHAADGRTPAHLVAAAGAERCLPPLLRRGADLSALDSNGNTPLDLARSSCHERTAAAIRAAGRRPSGGDEFGVGLEQVCVCVCACVCVCVHPCCITAASPLHLPPAAPLYLPCISRASPQVALEGWQAQKPARHSRNPSGGGSRGSNPLHEGGGGGAVAGLGSPAALPSPRASPRAPPNSPREGGGLRPRGVKNLPRRLLGLVRGGKGGGRSNGPGNGPRWLSGSWSSSGANESGPGSPRAGIVEIVAGIAILPDEYGCSHLGEFDTGRRALP